MVTSVNDVDLANHAKLQGYANIKEIYDNDDIDALIEIIIDIYLEYNISSMYYRAIEEIAKKDIASNFNQFSLILKSNIRIIETKKIF